MGTTYTEAQYSTPEARQLIRDKFLPLNPNAGDIESAARYMSQTLRIGGMKVCRFLVNAAILEATSAE